MAGDNDAGVGDADLATRFMTAWKRIENHLTNLPGMQKGDMGQMLRWAERRRLITADAEDFLQACRRARNAYAHIAFEGYVGAVTLPPRSVVERLERLSIGLAFPGRAVSVASKARTCRDTDSVRTALDVMRAQDFSQVPYRHERHGWVLFTRRQVSAMVEAAADDSSTSLVDLSSTLREIGADPAVGMTVPARLPWSATVTEALESFEQTLVTPDDQPGGYPAVLLVREPGDAAAPAILTADDLPRLYQTLGR